MQMAVVEFARNVCGIEDAYSSEFKEEAKNPVIHIMEKQKSVKGKGGTMRLGAYPCALAAETLARRIYGQDEIGERHRHRYEFNNAYRQTAAGVRPGALRDLSRRRTWWRSSRLPDHPWFLGCQFHPEFKSRPMDPHPLFESFVGACLQARKG